MYVSGGASAVWELTHAGLKIAEAFTEIRQLGSCDQVVIKILHHDASEFDILSW